jgi:hypothetical protein
MLADEIESIGSVALNDNLGALADMGIDTIELNTSLSALDAIFDTISAESSPDIVITGGIGDIDEIPNLEFANGDNDPDGNDLNVTLELSADQIEAIGSVPLALDTSLSILAGMGIDTIELNTSLSALDAIFDTISAEFSPDIVITGGIGDLVDNPTLEFADGDLNDANGNDLNVTLELSADQIADLGSVALNNSLGALVDMGIDTIELNTSLSALGDFGPISADFSPDIFISGGIGDFDEIADSLQFANGDNIPGENDLDVTLDVTDDMVDGTVNLSGSDLATLNAMGIDTITGDNGTSVVIGGFTDDFTLADFIGLDLVFTDGFIANDLLVTLDMTDAGTVALTTEEEDALRDMGIDFINTANDEIDLGDLV